MERSPLVMSWAWPFCNPPYSSLFKLQTIPHALPHTLLELCEIVPPQTRGLDVRRRLVVGARQHGDDGEQDCLWGLHGRPPLGGRFVAVLVLLGRVQDADAHVAVGVDVWVEERRLEAHLGRQQRVLGGEGQTGAEEASTVVLCFVVDHEHDFPLEDVGVDQPAGDAGYALVVLHLLELAGKEAGGGGGGRHGGACGVRDVLWGRVCGWWSVLLERWSLDWLGGAPRAF